MTAPPDHKVSIFDTPLLARAGYLAHVVTGDFGHPGLQMSLEHGRFHCGPLLNLLDPNAGHPADPEDPRIAEAKRECDLPVAQQLLENRGFLLIVEDSGPHWLTADDIVAASAPIDTPAKALLVTWVRGYDVGWYDGHNSYGTLEDGRVRGVDGGFEVASGISRTESDCNPRHPREHVRNLRLTLFVDRAGKIVERDPTEVNAYDVADPCHPL